MTDLRTPLPATGLARRRALLGFGAATAGAALPLRPAQAGSPGEFTGPSPANAWVRNYAQVAENYGPTRLGGPRPLPKGLRGTLYRNGPARMHRGPSAYHHWFDGDGLIQSFRLGDRGVIHQARMIRTAKYEREEQAGRFLYPAFGTTIADPAKINGADDLNPANISVLPVGGEILALWEAGSAHRIDAQTLETRGRQVWSPETDGLPFSAHPKVGPDGQIWSFGYVSGQDKLVLYQIDARNRLKRTGIIDAPNADLTHDFAVTDRYLVFVLMPLTRVDEPSAPDRGFLGQYAWHGELGSTVLVVSKADFKVVQRFEIPATAFFHVANAWEEKGTIRLYLARHDDWDRFHDSVYQAMRGSAFENTRSQMVELSIPLAGGAQPRIEVFDPAHVEFPRVAPRAHGRPTRWIHTALRTPDASPELFGFNALATFDLRTGRTQQYAYGPHIVVEEHVPVPRPGGTEGSGWLIGSAYDWLRGRALFSVFNVQAIDAGPIWQAALPYATPLGLHGAFVPA